MDLKQLAREFDQWHKHYRRLDRNDARIAFDAGYVAAQRQEAELRARAVPVAPQGDPNGLYRAAQILSIEQEEAFGTDPIRVLAKMSRAEVPVEVTAALLCDLFVALKAAPLPVAQAAVPVGEASAMPGTDGFTVAVFKAVDVPLGTKLYAAPQAPQPQAKVITDDEIKAVAVKYATHAGPGLYDITEYDCEEDFFNCVRAIAAMAAREAK